MQKRVNFTKTLIDSKMLVSMHMGSFLDECMMLDTFTSKQLTCSKVAMFVSCILYCCINHVDAFMLMIVRFAMV